MTSSFTHSRHQQVIIVIVVIVISSRSSVQSEHRRRVASYAVSSFFYDISTGHRSIVDHDEQQDIRASSSSTRVSSFISIRSSAERALLLAESASDESLKSCLNYRTELAGGHTSSTIKIRESSIHHQRASMYIHGHQRPSCTSYINLFRAS